MAYFVLKSVEMTVSGPLDLHSIILNKCIFFLRHRKVITAKEIIYRLHNLPVYHVALQSSYV